jgi:hypothetical protein
MKFFYVRGGRALKEVSRPFVVRELKLLGYDESLQEWYLAAPERLPLHGMADLELVPETQLRPGERT